MHRDLGLLCRDRPCSARLACPAPVLDVFPLLRPVISLAYLCQRLRYTQVDPRLAVVDGGQDLRDPLGPCQSHAALQYG
ncbi:hypothetical protein T01_900 [Trichinella spiralis]|uniref:Uncharacterized protein n=1 Tax=Trichinella spiralis TaxID=6334 RepID=A0A0V1BPJ6_TRISP|nr:hypothetical protein T01_900 [Trichinella spiralis]